MTPYARLQINGEETVHELPCPHLPPVGTQFPVDKHLTPDGAAHTLEVVEHEWRLQDAVRYADPSAADEAFGPMFLVTIKTRIVDEGPGDDTLSRIAVAIS